MHKTAIVTISLIGGMFVAAPLLTTFDENVGMCGTDYWGGRSNDLAKDSETQITVTAITSVQHPQTHSGCSGTIEAQPYLEKSNPWAEICTGSWGTASHSSTGVQSVIWHERVCSGLGSGWYRSRGRHRGFGESIFVSDPWAETDLAGQESNCQNFEACVGFPPCSMDHILDEACNCCKTPPEGSPIIFDLRNNGFRLTDRRNGVMFDLNVDGVAELISWTAAGADDSWLALDRNGNGGIDNGAELFGNFTPQLQTPEPNGFVALAAFDTPVLGGNADGWIDGGDEVFSRLRLWRDANHDGVSQSGELLPLIAGGVQRVSLEYFESRRIDSWGNAFRFRSRVQSAQTPPTAPWAYDVFLDAGR